MAAKRIIARLDIKAPYLIKGVHLEGLRKLGDPRDFSQRYYEQGIDEILYIDAVASLYDRNTIIDLVRHTAENIFVPITVGGGVRSEDDAGELLKAGADKVAVNTAAVTNPDVIQAIATRFGSQCVTLSIQAKRQDSGWEAYCDNGRERTGLDPVEWAVKGQSLGAGEILVTSVDQEGTGRGYDMDLTRLIAEAVDVPVVASGGMGNAGHLRGIFSEGMADGAAMANVLHYDKETISDLRREMIASGIDVRPCH